MKCSDIVNVVEKAEKFCNISVLISQCDAQEAEEMVRKRRRSNKLEGIVSKLNLESEEASTTQNTSSFEDKTTTTFIPFCI